MNTLWVSWVALVLVGVILAVVIFKMLHWMNVYIRMIPASFLVTAGLLSGSPFDVGVRMFRNPSWHLIINICVGFIGMWSELYFICAYWAFVVRRKKPL